MTMPWVFFDNPRRADFALSDAELQDLCARSAEAFGQLPLVYAGESTTLRRTKVPGILVQRMLPSLNSITFERKGAIEGTAKLRQRISEILWSELHRREISTCHLASGEGCILLSEERLPPIEVIVKAALVGTPARVYEGLLKRRDRFGERLEEHARHEPYVRFDYKNPLVDAAGKKLRDECMPLALAHRFIDTSAAETNALRIFGIIADVLRDLELEVLDACYLFDETGRVLCYELSPDNMRIKHARWTGAAGGEAEYDKDLWRHGASEKLLKQQWGALLRRLEERRDA